MNWVLMTETSMTQKFSTWKVSRTKEEILIVKAVTEMHPDW